MRVPLNVRWRSHYFDTGDETHHEGGVCRLPWCGWLPDCSGSEIISPAIRNRRASFNKSVGLTALLVTALWFSKCSPLLLVVKLVFAARSVAGNDTCLD